MRYAAPSGPLLVTGGGESNELDRPSISSLSTPGGGGAGQRWGSTEGPQIRDINGPLGGAALLTPLSPIPAWFYPHFAVGYTLLACCLPTHPPSRYGSNSGSRRRDLPRDWETKQAAGGYNFPMHRLKAVTPPCVVLVANPRNHVSGPYRCPGLGCTAARLLFGGGRPWRGGRCGQSGGAAAATRRWIF